MFEILGVDAREAPPNTRESVANQLAGRLLLPVAWFKPKAVRAGWDLFELKREFSTASHELIARRMLDFEPAVMITVFDHGRIDVLAAEAEAVAQGVVAGAWRAWLGM